MKKLLVLLVIASLATLANGMVLQISVNGDYNVEAIGDFVASDTLTLGIYATEAYAADQDLYFGLVVSADTAALGTIDNLSGVINMPPAPDGTMLDSEMAIWPGSGVYGFIGSMTIPQTAGSIGAYITDVIFHCEGPGDVIVQLWSTLDGENFSIVDEVTIHQIPEPATIALLCLGGLLLRKKK